MTTPRSAAIYARISSDPDGTSLGVQRQLKDCRALATAQGWTVGDEYVDNDISAFSGKRRPEYERMLADVRDGLRDGVVVYHMDRLTRRPIELEQFVATVEAAGVTQVRFVAGHMDLGTGDGLLIARVQGAVAADGSNALSRRIRRKMLANAEAGLPHGSWTRPFGYEPDKVTIRESEAGPLREVVSRFIAGEALRPLCRWLDSEGVVTPAGGQWRTTTLRNILRAGRIAGLRDHNGQVIGPAVWPGIISEDERRQVLAVFEQRQRTGKRAVQTYLLTGLLRCGKCGGKLFSSRRVSSRRYVCLSGPDHRGCGHLTVVADPVERLIADAVLYRLDTAELRRALSGAKSKDKDATRMADDLGKLRARLDELAGMFGIGEITRREWLTARKPIEASIEQTERKIDQQTGTGQLRALAGQGDSLREQWATLNLNRQHTIVGTVLDHAVIGPGTSGARSLDPARVQPVWRL